MTHATVLPFDREARTTPTPAEIARDGFLSAYDGETLTAYSFDLAILFAWCASEQLDPFQVTRLDLERFVRHLIDVRRNGPATLRRRLAAIRRFYRLAAHDGLIRVSPADYVRIPRSHMAHSDELDLGLDRHEMGALFAAARRSRPVDAALVGLMGLMGLRVSEACSIDVEQTLVQEQGHRVLAFVGKGGKPAKLAIPPSVARVLDEAAHGRTSGPLLDRPGHGRMTRAAAAAVIRRLTRDAGITRHIACHDLRRGYISNMLDAGVPLRDVQTAARHADPRMTMRYDRARRSLDRSGNYALATYIAGAM